MNDAQSNFAHEYHDAGWHPFELPPNQKHPPPSRCTGYDGVDLTAEQIAAASWAGNVGVRMPEDVIGFDVDVYRGGNDTLAALVDKLGTLPQTWISHNGRNDGSGIRFFRVQVGRSWTHTLPGIDIVQRNHRYAVVCPSVHPEGRDYGWWDQTIGAPAEAIPKVDELPLLPWAWVEHMSRDWQAGTRSVAVEASARDEFTDEHIVDAAPGYRTVIAGYFVEHWRQGFSRHDTMQHCLNWALEHVRADVIAAKPTLQLLGERWVEALDGEPKRQDLSGEFDAMVRHAVGKANAKTQAELHKLHDDVVGIPMQVTSSAIAAYQDDDQSSVTGGRTTLADLLARTGTDHDWLIVDLVERRDRVMLTGAEGGGKSTLLRQIALAASAGLHPFTNQAIPPLRVLLVDCENSERQLRRAFTTTLTATALAGRTDAATERLYVEVRSEGLVLDVLRDPDGDRAWLEETVRNARPDVLALGPVYKLIQGDATEEAPCRELVKFIDRLRVRHNVAVLLEAHTPHEHKRPYGWSGWKRWPEFGLHLDAGGAVTRWRGDREERRWPDQLRRGARGEWPWMTGAPIGGVPVLLTPREKQYVEVKLEVARVLRQAKRPLTRDEVVDRSGRRKVLVLKALREYQDGGGVLVTAGVPAANGKPTELFAINPHGNLVATP